MTGKVREFLGELEQLRVASPVAGVADDGLSDAEIGALTGAWLRELNDVLAFEVGETAAEARRRLWVYGEP